MGKDNTDAFGIIFHHFGKQGSRQLQGASRMIIQAFQIKHTSYIFVYFFFPQNVGNVNPRKHF